MRLSRTTPAVSVPAPVLHQPAHIQFQGDAPVVAEKGNVTAEPIPAARSGHEIKSPMVGTFYTASSPDLPPFVKVGQKVNVGDTVCLVEAMKMFNEIESDKAGTVKEILVENGQAVEYDQSLFIIE